jgi:hypothetical protein
MIFRYGRNDEYLFIALGQSKDGVDYYAAIKRMKDPQKADKYARPIFKY